jgi:hypothetical protein
MIQSRCRAFVMMATLFVALGCSDSKTEPEQQHNHDFGTMSGTINGAAWTGSTVIAARSGTTVSMTGRDAQDREIIITITGVSSSGSFATGPGGAAAVSYRTGNQAWVGHLAGASGAVTLSTLTSTGTSGTFAVVLQPQGATGATGTITLAGTFNVHFGQT